MLEHERFGFGLAQNANGFAPHISMIFVSTMAAADGEWLAGRPAAYDIDFLKLSEVDRPNIRLGYFGPFIGGRATVMAICCEGVAAPFVTLNDRDRLDTSTGESHAEPPSSGE